MKLPLSIYDGKCKDLLAEKRKGVNEFTFGKPLKFKIFEEDKDNKEFRKIFKLITNFYKKYKFNFLSTEDSFLIQQFCHTYLELKDLRRIKGLAKSFEQIACVNSAINRKRDLLLRLAKELYLAPEIRLRTRVKEEDYKREETEEEKIAKEMFG